MTPAIISQLLTSALIYIRNREQKPYQCRALLDTCAAANFITETVVRRLKLTVDKQSIPINTIGNLSTMSRGLARITIQSKDGSFRKELSCLIVPTISDLVPSEVFPRSSVRIPSNIKLADPEFHLPRPIDVLIGSGITLSLFSVGQIDLSRDGCEIYLQKTQLGWVIAGGAASSNRGKTTCHFSDLQSCITNFWEIEEIALNKPQSQEERECEFHFVNNVTRRDDGRYTVRLPFRRSDRRLGESRTAALRRLMALERKFNTNATFKSEYIAVMAEYIRLGHMSILKGVNDDGYYMPHHAVIKEASTTTKVRVVFDASAKTNNGASLNDVLMVGPTIQAKLLSHLLRIRIYRHVVIADIEKMYRQVRVHKDDRRYQRILWRENGEIRTYQLNTLTFGVSSSPFLAIRTLQQLAQDERIRYPKAAEILLQHVYVDDLMSGANSIIEARAIRDEVIALLKRGGFAIRQWASDDERVINDLDSKAVHKNFVADADRSLKTLGVSWRAPDDKIYYTTRLIDCSKKWTKRNILSEIAKIFDPLGLLGPTILYAKRIMQDLWRSGLQWDESVSQGIHTEWSIFVEQMKTLEKISFERKVLIDGYREVQIHGFCDASERGYGACIYVRSRDDTQTTFVRLLCSKSRVSPLKIVSIPRLELCGALLLARLFHEVKDAIGITTNKPVFWCDSTVALHWINTSPHLLKTFVANRVTEIQRLTCMGSWRHVRSEDNPADALSRGQTPQALSSNALWFAGPRWLGEEEDIWPVSVLAAIELPELRPSMSLAIIIGEIDITKKYSSHVKLVRIVAYCLRFLRQSQRGGPLTAAELDRSETRILRMVQVAHFTEIIETMKGDKRTNPGRIANLSPFLDNDGLIRLGGRLQNSELSFQQKHPILLPRCHQLTDNIICEMHERHHHAGIKATLYNIRQKFWILDGHNQVRKIVRNCVRCFRYRAKTIQYKMGNLPIARVRESVPFLHTGIDFAGPFYIKERKYRNRNRIKVYVCIFVCMSIKAIHLELVSDLTSDGFIAALRRFTARRGLPVHIYSDNGTNFVGANNQLKELHALFNSDEHKDATNRFASENRIVWHFIPPAAPHYGGLWESAVRMFKHHFKRVIGDSLFTFEELNTFVIEVEGVLNSRPITNISPDPNNLLVLTPAHYMIGRPLIALPERDISSVPVNRLST